MIEVAPNYNQVEYIFKALGQMRDLGNNIGINLVRQSAQDYANAIKANIDTQVFGDFGKPMSPKWKQTKAKTMPDTANMFWKWLGTLYQNIQFVKSNEGNNSYLVFVASQQTKHGNTADYAYINEIRRPLFEKSYIKFRPEWNKKCAEYFMRIKTASGTVGH